MNTSRSLNIFRSSIVIIYGLTFLLASQTQALVSENVASAESPFTSFLRPITHLCGAVRIAKRFALTAGHCVIQSPEEMTGLFKDNAQVWSPGGRDYDRFRMDNIKIHVHPTWQNGIDSGMTPDQIADDPNTSDLAIIEFDVDTDSGVMPEEIPILPASLAKDMEVRLTGSGCESESGRGDFGDYKYIDSVLSALQNGRAITNSKHYCLGDSGSPVFVNVGGDWYLTGIASTTTPNGKSDVFARVDGGSSAYEWIESVIE